MNEFDFIENTLTSRREQEENNKRDNQMESILQRKKENNNPIKTFSGAKVSNINQARFKQEIQKKKQFKIKGSWQTRIIVLSVAVAIALGIYVITKNNRDYTLPEDKKTVVYTEVVERDDTFYSVLDDYYKENSEHYKGLYKNEKGYEKKVLELNNLSKPDTVNYYGELDVPIILDVNSEEYKLFKEIEALKKEKQDKYFFVKHIVKQGDTISHLASLAAFDNNELIKYTQIIMNRNGGDLLVPETEIEILNPELFEVSQRLNATIERFESIIKSEVKNR